MKRKLDFWFQSKAKDVSSAKELSASHERLSPISIEVTIVQELKFSLHCKVILHYRTAEPIA
jgi:hypothetical protein